MNWVVITIIILAVFVAVCAVIKIYLRKKLSNIDGMYGVFKTDRNTGGEAIIGMFGDDNKGKGNS